jgi:hypothetical protein
MMRKGIILALAVSCVYAPLNAEDRTTGDQEPRAGMRREDRVLLNNDDLSKIRRTLGDVLEAALTKDLESTVDYFAKADRDRLDTFAGQHNTATQTQLAEFREGWRARFNRDYDFDADKIGASVFNYEIVPGVNDKSARVTIPASRGLPAVTLQLVNEGIITDSWRIDAPDKLSGERLRDGLVRTVSGLSRDRNAWPADETELHRTIAHRVLAALQGAEGPGNS